MYCRISGILFIAAMLMSIVTLAQAPGYMGKRFSAHYENQLWYSFTSRHMDLFHIASAEYVITLSHVLALRYTYSGLQTQFDKINTPDGASVIYDVRGLVRTHALSVWGKFFSYRKGFIAPVGRYTSCGAGFLYHKSYASETRSGLHSGDELHHYADVIVYFGQGRQFVFAERLILNVGVQVGLPAVTAFRIRSGLLNGDLYSRVFFASLFRAQVGMGFLAF
ncbi:MAG: hypothetical protein KatS3mg031_0587 [Chitinophagales bacterium]|nr:MAG: hypothetical protein KatS3mg031_0587 [Chitinophagales bacterium]